MPESMAPSFRLYVRRPGGIFASLDVEGALDLNTCPVVRDVLDGLLEGGETRLLVNLTRASYLDSTLLHLLIETWRRLRGGGGDFVVVVPRSRIRRAFDVTGVGRLLRICSGKRSAVRRLTSLVRNVRPGQRRRSRPQRHRAAGSSAPS